MIGSIPNELKKLIIIIDNRKVVKIYHYVQCFMHVLDVRYVPLSRQIRVTIRIMPLYGLSAKHIS